MTIQKIKQKSSKIQELFAFDESHKKDVDFVIGTDEAGRGPGAGPVFAAAVCFKEINDNIIQQLTILDDSKKLSEKHREELYEIIVKNAIYYIKAGSVEEIDTNNILNTSLNCMKISVQQVNSQLGNKKTLTLVDGNKLIKQYKSKQKTIVKGDAKSAAIAAASILSKVSRDRFMYKIAKEFPQYDWENNKGYLTTKHIEAIKKYGTTKWHRKKFLRKILEPVTEQLELF